MHLKKPKITISHKGLGTVLLLSSIVACTSTASATETYFKISIDPKVWTNTASLSWPNKARYVNVVMGATSSTKICGKALTENAKKGLALNTEGAGLTFGLACNELWVLFPLHDQRLLKLSDYQKKAVAAHEAFHLAVQLYSQRKVRIEDALDFEYIIRNLPTTKIRQTDIFFKKIITSSQTTPDDANAVCKDLLSSYKSYDNLQINYMRSRISSEWPAEFYMRESFYQKQDNLYYSFRNGLYRQSADNLLYVAGTDAIKRIEHAMTRKDWQHRYLAGETLLNIYFESLGCTKPDGPAIIGVSNGIGNSIILTQ